MIPRIEYKREASQKKCAAQAGGWWWVLDGELSCCMSLASPCLSQTVEFYLFLLILLSIPLRGGGMRWARGCAFSCRLGLNHDNLAASFIKDWKLQSKEYSVPTADHTILLPLFVIITLKIRKRNVKIEVMMPGPHSFCVCLKEWGSVQQVGFLHWTSPDGGKVTQCFALLVTLVTKRKRKKEKNYLTFITCWTCYGGKA